MTVRTKTTILLIVAIPFSWEFWRFFKNDHAAINPWLNLNYPLAKTWVLKFFGNHMGELFSALVIYRLSRMQEPIRMAAKMLLLLKVIDMLLFWYNFNKEDDYALLYNGVSFATLLYIFFKQEISLWLNRTYFATRRKLIRSRLKFELWKRNRRTPKSVPCGTTTIIKQQTVEA